MKHKLKTMRVYDLVKAIKMYSDDVLYNTQKDLAIPYTNGYRILVDRLWPRGINKEKLEPFYWAKEAAPSNELRKWFGHDPDRFDEFRRRYIDELNNSVYAQNFKMLVLDKLKEDDVLLLFAARDKEMNQAVILKDWIIKIIS
ncbi:DUF488 domain-containing protein [Butyrivibrio fibrisolvens]|nr:DUF488 family protein [Butyrivibrio fibrisolvens]